MNLPRKAKKPLMVNITVIVKPGTGAFPARRIRWVNKKDGTGVHAMLEKNFEGISLLNWRRLETEGIT